MTVSKTVIIIWPIIVVVLQTNLGAQYQLASGNGRQHLDCHEKAEPGGNL